MIESVHASDQRVDPNQPALFLLPQQWKRDGKAVALEKVKVSFPALKADPLKIAQLKNNLYGILKRNRITVSKNATQQIRLRLGKVEAAGQ